MKPDIKKTIIFFIDPSLSFLEIHGKMGMEVPVLSLVASFLKLLNTYLVKYKELEKLKKTTEIDI